MGRHMAGEKKRAATVMKRSKKPSYSYKAKKRAHIHKANVKTRTVRYKPNTRPLREMRHYQGSTDPLVQKRPFRRTTEDVVAEVSHRPRRRVAEKASSSLQEASEAYMIDILGGSNLFAIHTSRPPNATITKRDLWLVRRIKQR